MLAFPDVLNILQEGHCFDFLREEAEGTLEEIRREQPDAFSLLTDGALENIKTQYFDRMVLPYFHTFSKKLRGAAATYDAMESLMLRGDHPEALQKAANDVAQSLGKDAARTLRLENPLLRDCVDPIRQNFTKAQIRMLRDIENHKKQIEEVLLDGKSFKKIIALSGDSGDMHRHGRVVRRIDTDVGSFYYKPHDCRTDLLYRELVQTWFSDCTIAANAVCGEDCGFLEKMEFHPLSEGQTPGDYFRNFGMLSSLFHSLCSRDMNHENFLACGVYPVAVDLETILCPKARKEKKMEPIGEAEMPPAQQDLKNSVKYTAILPAYSFKEGMHSPLYDTGEGVACLPVLDGREFTVAGFEKDFTDGFSTGYDRIMKHRDEIYRIAERFRNIPIRYVMNNTRYYCIVRRDLYRNQCMQDVKARQKTLEKLEIPFVSRGRNVPEVIRYEQGCLMEGDIPYYCCRADGHDLCGEDLSELLYSGFFEKSALETLHDRLIRMSQEEKSFEMSWISASLRHAETKEPGNPSSFRKAEKPITTDEARKVIQKILSNLRDDRVAGSHGETFWYRVSDQIVREPDCGAVSTIADAVLFSEIAKVFVPDDTISQWIQEIRQSFLIQMRQNLQYWQSQQPVFLQSTLPLNDRTGIGALIRTMGAMNHAENQDADLLLNDLLRMIVQHHLFSDQTGRGGEAGLLLALSEFSSGRVWQEEDFGKSIRGCTDSLLHTAPPRIDDDARFALAMTRLGESLRNETYRKAASDAWERIRSAALSEGGWHDTYAETSWICPSGNNTAFIGLCAILAGKASGDLPEIALRAVLNEKAPKANDSLTEGNAMTALFLVQAFKAFNRQEWLEEAGRILGGMNQRMCQDHFDASFYRGTPGIGYATAEYLKARQKCGKDGAAGWFRSDT